jgi:uncharacterized protein DUF4397
MRWTLRLAASAAVLMAPLAVGAAPTTGAAPAASGQGWARFGHFAPSVEPVNIFVDGSIFASSIGFKQVSQYGSLPAGVHRFDLRLSSDPDGPVIFTVDAGVPADGAVTIGAVTTRDGVASHVFDDDLATPSPGQSLVRIIHAAPDVPAIEVQVVAGPMLVASVPYPGASAYQEVQPGTYDVQVRPAGSSEVLLEVDGWTIEPGVQSSVAIVKGSDGRLDVVAVRDAAAVAVAPAGGVQTGYGGMADAPSSNTRPLVITSVAALGFAGLAFTAVARRRRLASR